MRVEIMIKLMLRVRSFPILAVPWCLSIERVPKLTIVVRALKNTARAVLVPSIPLSDKGAKRKRCKIWIL